MATGSKFPPGPERRKPSKFCNKNQQRHREIHKLRRRRWPFQLCEPTGNITLIRSSNGTARIPLHVRMPASRGTGTHGGTSATFWGRTHQPCQLQGKGQGNGCTPFPCLWSRSLVEPHFEYGFHQGNNHGSYRPRAFREAFPNCPNHTGSSKRIYCG